MVSLVLAGEIHAMSPRLLLIVTALVEAPTGLCLLAFPDIPFALLFGLREPAPETLVVSRVAGAALLAIGVASWLARRDTRSRAQLGLLTGILIYNAAVAAILAVSALNYEAGRGRALARCFASHRTWSLVSCSSP